jgi:hypothetical protein
MLQCTMDKKATHIYPQHDCMRDIRRAQGASLHSTYTRSMVVCEASLMHYHCCLYVLYVATPLARVVYPAYANIWGPTTRARGATFTYPTKAWCVVIGNPSLSLQVKLMTRSIFRKTHFLIISQVFFSDSPRHSHCVLQDTSFGTCAHWKRTFI